ncbi:MAG: MalY/PatB family protein, partial [Geminicoccaceae bacterium]
MFDFDEVIDRRGTHAMKWDMIAARSGIEADDAIPMWVADMDFRAPPGVTDALRAEVERGTHGYYADTGSWAEALCGWMQRRHDVTFDPSWVSQTPGVVSGLGLILQAVSEPGDEIVLFPPVYHAFRRIIPANDRRILDAPMSEADGRYQMDLEALAERLTPRTKAVFFCNPHNPGGTVWTAEEIQGLAALCERHDLILVSDEIHCDIVFEGATYIPAIKAAPEIADRLITTVAATKTFNLASAHAGACVTSNPELKKRLDKRIAASGLASYNGFGMI